MVNCICFVPGCNTAYRRKENDDEKRYSMFIPPQDPDLLEKWKRAIPRKDRELTRKDRVCELHFTDDEIERFYITELVDGTIHKMEKSRPSLKSDAVPTQFPNLPSYLSKNVKKRKLPSRNAVSNSQVKKIANGNKNVACTSSDIDGFNGNLSCLEKITFETIIEAHHLKPNKWWSISEVGDIIVCARWNQDIIVEKRIVIDADLQAKVYLRNKEINMPIEKINSMFDLSTLLKNVENFKFCAGAIDNATTCSIYLSEEEVKRHCIWCPECKILKKKILNSQHKKSADNKLQTLSQKMKCYTKRNTRLKQKVNLLNQKMENLKKLCAATKTDTLKEAISSLSPLQQESFLACLDESKRKN